MPWFTGAGAHIWYEETGQGPPVLLLPGFSDRIQNHQRLIASLGSLYRVVAADLPGSGGSGPQPRVYHPDYYRDDAKTFLDMMEALGIEKPAVLGYSDGGEVALLMAATAPERLRSVLTWGASGTIADPGGHIANWFRNVTDPGSPDGAGYRDYLLQVYGAKTARAMTHSFADALDAIAAAGGDISRSLAHRILCPVLMLAGEADAFCPKPLLQDFATAAAPGRVTIDIVPGAGHGLHDDLPDWFVDRVRAWLGPS